MALLKSCLCCGILLGSIVSGFITAILYFVAFAVYLWWIVETETAAASSGNGQVGGVTLPGYLLCVGYAIVSVLSAAMLYGLSKRKEKWLLAWLLIMVLFFFPEMGMVFFMALYQWKISTSYGLADIVFYVFRAASNVLCIICVQVQYTWWKEDRMNKETLKRLEKMHLDSISKQHLQKLESEQASLSYHNPSFVASSEALPSANGLTAQAPLTRSYSSASQFSGYRVLDANLRALRRSFKSDMTSLDPFMVRDSQSEFNAALYTSSQLGFYSALSQAKSIDGMPVGNRMYQRTLPFYPQMKTLYANPRGDYSYASPYPVMTPNYSTQSLDRSLLRRGGPRSFYPDVTGIATRPSPYRILPGYVARPPFESKSSLGAESDDFRKYRDVAL